MDREPSREIPAPEPPTATAEPRTVVADPPVDRPRYEVAPPATVASFGRMTGVDLGFVPVIRTPRAAPSSPHGEAAAYTRNAVVHLPVDTGDLDSADNTALLGHELTHVAQQRALGALADEAGELGERLEAQAVGVERALRGESVTPEELGWPTGTTPTGSLAWSPDAGFTRLTDPYEVSAVEGGDQRRLHAVAGPAGPAQRATLTRGTGPLQEPGPAGQLGDSGLASLGSPSATGPATGVLALLANGEPEPESPSQPLVFPEDAADSEGRAASGPEQPQRTITAEDVSDEVLDRLAARLRVQQPRTRINPRDPELLDALALGLYGRLRTRLRGELLADRERAGLLTEFH